MRQIAAHYSPGTIRPVKVRLLVCDVDGTLLDPAGQLAPDTVAAVRAAVAAGCIVTLATGRRFRTAKPVADALGLALPILVQNGALIKDSRTGAVLFHHHLPSEAAALAIRYFWQAGAQPIVYENAFTGERLFTGPAERDGDDNRDYLSRNAELVRRCTLPELLAGEPPLEVAILDAAERVQALVPGLAHPCLRSVPTGASKGGGAFLEVLAAECSKAEALRALARHFDVPMAATMAIGDNLNDLEILEAAGIGVAMGNAVPAVRAAARYATASNAEDGVAATIACFLLDRSPAGESAR